MRTRQVVAFAVAAAISASALPLRLAAAGQQSATISGTARNEAKKPYADYTTRARNSQNGQIAGMTPLDMDAKFSLANLPPASYVVELLDHDGKVVCTDGPFNLTQQLVKDDVKISCNKVPVAWWLLGAAAAAGITAGVLAGGTASPAQ
jgi:hypothetical protein